MIDNPLISVCFTCYNREEYVAEALKSVLAQTYSPLEIIVSDNCSTDGTKEIVQELITKYQEQNGSHKIIFNSNSSNIGGVRNIEKCFMLAHGELLICAHDDDISLPDRAEKIVEAWLKGNRSATGVSCEFFPMAVDGTLKSEEWWKLTIRNPIGASMAYSPVVIKNFPPIEILDAYDDNVFIRRAYAYGDITWLPDKLVKYRVGSGVTSRGSYASTRQRISRGMIAAARQNLIDMEYCKGKVDESHRQEIIDLAHEIMDSYGVEYGYNPLRKFSCFLRSCRRRGQIPYSRESLIREFLFVGYPGLFAAPRRVYARLKKLLTRA